MSGKVNEVTYQPNQPDQFIHRYEYDAENRIKNVKTSRDDVFFDNDASYYYYLHGPLARVEIGEERVQGIDYVYTLQGWIKGVNSNSLDAKVDPGMDGDMSGSNHNFAKDAFGYTLNYFNGDYQAINPDKTSFETNFIAHTENFDNLAHDAPNLYNGNISSMATTIVNNKEYEVLPQFTMYKYDQLNRLKSMKAFADFNFERNVWEYDGYKGRYENNFEYDANGNIETAVAKNAKGDVIDNQIYNYVKEGYNKQNNRLYCIADDAAITSGKDLPSGQDAFDYEDLLNNNYRYNELGELVYDKQMGIDKIIWGNNGKIRTVTHTEASRKYNLEFDYNHTGKRIAKHVYNQDNTLLRSEYYTRDASDNVMAVYRLEVDEQNQEVSYRLKERHIYGSSMLGIDRLEVELIDPIAPSNTQSHIVGLKSYTGSNHLGNVLTTFSDKKLPVDENSDGMIDYYQPHIISSSDYAPFGAQLAERSFFSETYPNSFNDKRDDPELGDWQDYGMRMYSPWQRRFPSPDPLIVYGQEYPWYSPYQFAGNKPIWAVDLDGLEEYVKLAVEDKGGKVNTMRVIPWSEIYPAETHGPWGKGTVDYTLRDQPRNNNTRHMNVRVQFQTNVNGVKIKIDGNICVETRGKTKMEKFKEWDDNYSGKSHYTRKEHTMTALAVGAGFVTLATANPAFGIASYVLMVNSIAKQGSNNGESPLGSAINSATDTRVGDVAIDLLSISMGGYSIMRNSLLLSSPKSIDNIKSVSEWVMKRTADGVSTGTSGAELIKDIKKETNEQKD